MRLTLRTMLAYLDNVLEPGDAEQLRHKIQDSEVASGLVHRVRSSIRRLRLGAPKVDGKGLGLDANSVSEYLDNTMPAERVPDFERVCLESDMHLAEVAACHQVLTLVLGEAAEIPPGLRERVYSLASLDAPPKETGETGVGGAVDQQAEPGPVEAPPAPSDEVEPPPKEPSGRLVEPPSPEESKEPVSRAKPEVPDYLRATRRTRLWPAALAMLLLFALAIVGLRILGEFDQSHPLAALFGGSRAPTSDSTADAVEAPPQDRESKGDGGQTTEDDGADDVVESDGAPDQPPVAPTASDDGDDVVPIVPGTSARLPGGGVIAPADPPTPPQPAKSTDGAPAGVVPDSPSPIPSDAPRPFPPAPEPSPIAPEVVERGADLGKYVSAEQLLVTNVADIWQRLPVNAPLSSGSRLLALPSFRPQIALAAGLQVTLPGPTSLDLQGPIRGGVPLLKIDYGRAIIVTIGRGNTHVGLQLGDRFGVATLIDADSALAVEVTHFLPPGGNPTPAPGEPRGVLTAARIYAVKGRIQWEEGGTKLAVNEGQLRILFGDAPGGRTIDAPGMPVWKSPPRAIDHPDILAAQDLEESGYFKPGTPIQRTLVELTEHRRVDFRSLAARMLSYLDSHQQAIDNITNADFRSYWDETFDCLRAAIARSPESAARVRAELEKWLPEDGADMYRMLLGYDADKLASKGAAELVGYLEHERTGMRVLSAENLRRITGKTHLYRPESTVRSNRPRIQKWQKELADGKIVYEELPTHLPEIEPAARPAPMPPSDVPGDPFGVEAEPGATREKSF